MSRSSFTPDGLFGMTAVVICCLFALSVFWMTDTEEVVAIPTPVAPVMAEVKPDPLESIAASLAVISTWGKEQDIKPYDSRVNTPVRDHLSDKYSSAWDAENVLGDGFVVAPQIYITREENPKKSGTVVGVKAVLYHTEGNLNAYLLERPLEIEDVPLWAQEYIHQIEALVKEDGGNIDTIIKQKGRLS